MEENGKNGTFPGFFLMFLGQLMCFLRGPVPAPRRGRHIVKDIGPCLKTTLRDVENRVVRT